MRRTTVSLPDELADALEREARRRSVSNSAVVRDALAVYLGVGDSNDRRPLPFAAVGASGHRTTARDMEELLSAEWTGRARDR
jgi:metal-responsive CopG/Arc/MetJ family transcriptional regulator